MSKSTSGGNLKMETDLSEIIDIDWDKLTFSVTPTRSMYKTTCLQGEDWKPGELMPYGNISISPAAGVINYGQGLFEGMKAYRTSKGNIGIFRPLENAKRVNRGCQRLCMPEIPEKLFWEAIEQIVKDNEDYIPPVGRGALYIRPLVFGSGPVLGVKPAPEYTFLVYVTPVGPYFKGAMSGIHLKVVENFHRAPQFGTGSIKAIGNYAGGMYPAQMVKSEDFREVVYLDAREEKYIEEVGAANFFLIKGSVLASPELDGSILPGVTRMSVLEMAGAEFGYTVEERQIPVEEIFEGDEAFCSGTAAVITPIISMHYRDREMVYCNGEVGEKTLALYDGLMQLLLQEREDPYDWLKIL